MSHHAYIVCIYSMHIYIYHVYILRIREVHGKTCWKLPFFTALIFRKIKRSKDIRRKEPTVL